MSLTKCDELKTILWEVIAWKREFYVDLTFEANTAKKELEKILEPAYDLLMEAAKNSKCKMVDSKHATCSSCGKPTLVSSGTMYKFGLCLKCHSLTKEEA